MKRFHPLVSVIIPVLNGEAYLGEAIESVVRQSWTHTEMIVIDDGSTDGTADLVRWEFPQARYFHQAHAGIGAARNHGIDRAGGDFIAFLDADDYWMEHKLARQIQVFAEQPGTEMVFAHIKQFISPELNDADRARLRCPEEPMPAELPATMLCRPEVFARVGPFETRWKVGQDVSWIARARELRLNTVMVEEVLYMRRLHKRNNGNTTSEDFGDRLKIIKAMLDRRRARTSASGD
jgi:glycosyltransferase involved in cell wall biosynthesis